MSGNQLEMLLGLGIGISMGVAAGYVIYRAGKPYQPGEAVPSCPKCSYPVKGITSLACPECGVDFREVGIVPRKKHDIKLIGRSVVIGVIVAVICGVVLSVFFQEMM